MSRLVKVKLGYDDYLRFPDDGKRYEIFDGEVYMTPAPSLRHQAAVRNLVVALDRFLNQTGRGRVFVSPVDVVFDRYNVVQPDLVVLLQGGRARLTDAAVQGPPDVVVEVLSPATRERDMGLKLQLFARQGVSEYWVVDSDARSVAVHVLEGEAYGLRETLSGEAALASPLLEGFCLPLPELWRL